MSHEKALVKNTMILSIGTYMPKLMAIITLPLLTGYLSQTDYGIYDLVLTLVSLLLPALTLQIQSAAFRFLIICRNDKVESSKIITNIFAFTIPISVVGLFITYFFLTSLQLWTRLLVLLYFFFDILYIGCGQIARGFGKNLVYAISAAVMSIVSMICMVLSILVLNLGIDGIVLSLMVSNILAIIIMLWKAKLLTYIDFKLLSFKQIKKLLAYSWPMVPNALSNWVLSLSDRIVIIGVIGIEANAVYAVANKIPNLVKTFQGTFTSAWQENASISVTDYDSEKYYSKMFDSVNRIVIGIVAVLIVFTPILFKLLIRGDYDDAYVQMGLLYLGMYFSCMAGFIGGIYVAHMKTKSVGLTTIAAALINLVIDIALIRFIGLYAASISTMIAYMCLFFFRLFDVQKFQPVKVGYFRLIVYIIIIGLMSFLSGYRILALDIINAVSGIAFATFINLNVIKAVFKKIKKKFSRGRKK